MIEDLTDGAHAVRAVRFLVVDDDRDDRLLFDMAAEDSDRPVDVQFAGDGKEALKLLSKAAKSNQLPDVVILDIRMPELGGHETLEQIRANPELDSVQAVIFSSSHRQSEIRRSIAEGALWHEVKPSAYPDLVAFIEQVATRVGPSAPA